MTVVWNGLPTHPGGRQLFIEEEIRRPPPAKPECTYPRVLLQVGVRSAETKQLHDNRVKHLLKANPRTAREVHAVLGWPLEQTAQVIARLLRHGQIVRLGQRDGEYVYDVTEQEG